MSTRAIQQVDSVGRAGNALIDLRASARPVAVGVRAIPVQLVVTDLTSELTGDFETQCGFLYDVYAINADAETDDALLEDVDPTLLGHHHIRPTVGAMIAATFGYAHREDGDLKLGYINETQDLLGISIPVQLVVTSLTSELTGDFETQCAHNYDVYANTADPLTDDALLENVDPTASGHYHVRPTVGEMTAATFGYAHYEGGNLKLGYINETQNPLGIPVPEAEGDFALTSIDGVLQWATVSNFSCPV